MAKYLIHAIPKRMWYVEKYLIPSMKGQRISEKDITVYNDKKGEGNLQAFLSSLRTITEDTWHLQDDIILASNFAHMTSNLKEGLVCGFCSSYSKNAPYGKVGIKDMWFSFPCVRIPVKYTQEFPKWLEVVKDEEPYRRWIKQGKFDDSLFMEFLYNMHPEESCFNVNPNFVNHIDYLIGGSSLNANRDYKQAMSIYWKEPELLRYWENILKDGRKDYGI